MDATEQSQARASSRVIVIVGQTASGKSRLAIQTAKQLESIVVNADAFQVYSEFSVASDKVREDEMDGVTHFGLDLVSPTSEFTVRDFLSQAIPVIESELRAGRSPVIVGGTHMYVDKLLFTSRLDEDDVVSQPAVLSSDMVREYTFTHLIQVDPAMAARLHPNDQRRVSRAIDYFYDTGSRMSDKLREQTRIPRWPNVLVVCKEAAPVKEPLSSSSDVKPKRRKMTHDPSQIELEEKIRQRIQVKMIRDNKLKIELSRIAHMVSTGSLRWNKGLLQAIGYREFEAYVTSLLASGTEDDTLFERGVSDLIRNTVQYSKKQRKWIRKLESMIEIFHCSDFQCMQKLLQENCLSKVRHIPNWCDS